MMRQVMSMTFRNSVLLTILFIFVLSLFSVITYSTNYYDADYSTYNADYNVVYAKDFISRCITKPFYKYKYCPSDGYIKQQNGYKIIHYKDILYYMQSSNPALNTIGNQWYDIYLGFSFEEKKR